MDQLHNQHIFPIGIPLGEQEKNSMAHQPAEKGQGEPAKAPVGEQEEAHKEPQTGPGAGIEARCSKDHDPLPDPAQYGHLIAVKWRALLCHYKVAPATRPSVPSMAVPPPRMRRLRGRSYP